MLFFIENCRQYHTKRAFYRNPCFFGNFHPPEVGPHATTGLRRPSPNPNSSGRYRRQRQRRTGTETETGCRERMQRQRDKGSDAKGRNGRDKTKQNRRIRRISAQTNEKAVVLLRHVRGLCSAFWKLFPPLLKAPDLTCSVASLGP